MTPEALAALMARAYRHQPPWRTADIAAVLDLPTTRLFTGARGALIASQVLDEAEILAFAVDPDGQRQGAGAALLTRFHAESAGAGVTRCILEVAEDNAPARALYARHGYAEAGRRRAYYRRCAGPDADALVLARALP